MHVQDPPTQKNQRCVEEFRSTHNSPGEIENRISDFWRRQKYYRIEFLKTQTPCLDVR